MRNYCGLSANWRTNLRPDSCLPEVKGNVIGGKGQGIVPHAQMDQKHVLVQNFHTKKSKGLFFWPPFRPKLKICTR